MVTKQENDIIAAMRRIADIAHCGGLMGFEDIYDAMNEIRRLSLPWWDYEECDKLQREWWSKRKNMTAYKNDHY